MTVPQKQMHRWGRTIRWYNRDRSMVVVEGNGFESPVKAFVETLRRAINYGWTPPTELETWRRREDYWRWSPAEKRYALKQFGINPDTLAPMPGNTASAVPFNRANAIRPELLPGRKIVIR